MRWEDRRTDAAILPSCHPAILQGNQIHKGKDGCKPPPQPVNNTTTTTTTTTPPPPPPPPPPPAVPRDRCGGCGGRGGGVGGGCGEGVEKG
ncbi:hypothetical protein C0Q70_09654 [Pomacea canaliculata]|uniref:Uncharacterized protein n=1 Tax=Pomacea canaliculata TaxID=400727 RepID=A0A2T7PAE9_POMCA|nr:hypothetical protein C0Q70_09654 [Pomacea canaliculata]